MARRYVLLALIPVAVIGLALGVHAVWWFGGMPLGEYGHLFVPGPGSGVDVEVRVENRSENPTPAFHVTLIDGTARLDVPSLRPGASAALEFQQAESDGEQSLVIVDAAGRTYELVGYFEHSLGGRIDVRLAGTTAQGALIGVHRDRVSHFGSDEWHELHAVSE